MTKRAFNSIMTGLNEALAHSAGKKTGARVTRVRPINVADVREKTGLSQAEFAATYSIPLKTLQNWEQGTRQPTGASAVLLHVINQKPAAVTKVAKAARLEVQAPMMAGAD